MPGNVAIITMPNSVSPTKSQDALKISPILTSGAAALTANITYPNGGVIAPSVLVGLACGTPMFAFTARIKEPFGIGYVFRFLIVPMFILSGTFFPISELPALVQPVAAVSPLWHGVELVRLGGLGLETTWPPLAHAAVLVVIAILGMVVTTRTLAKRLHP